MQEPAKQAPAYLKDKPVFQEEAFGRLMRVADARRVDTGKGAIKREPAHNQGDWF